MAQRVVNTPPRDRASADPTLPRAVRRDLKLLADFIHLYCRQRHADADRHAVRLKTHDVEALCRRPIRLCASCRRLLTHAFVKRTRCPLEPKPACKRCPTHCYAPAYRAQIREVMKYSGRRLVLRGRLDYLYHLLF
jgi:hypothetical protein